MKNKNEELLKKHMTDSEIAACHSMNILPSQFLATKQKTEPPKAKK